jgi:hypothetical protein
MRYATATALWSLCARSLMETFGACVLISERPQTAQNYLTLRNPAGPLRKAAEQAQPGLENDIKRLDEIVHPGSRARVATCFSPEENCKALAAHN